MASHLLVMVCRSGEGVVTVIIGVDCACTRESNEIKIKMGGEGREWRETVCQRPRHVVCVVVGPDMSV